MYLLWTVIGVILLFLIIRFFVVSYAFWLTKLFVNDRHDDAETILETGRLPEGWVKTATRRRLLTKRGALRKLRSIIKYFRRTPYVNDEDQRAAIISRLQSVYGSWKSMPIDELMPGGY